MHWWGHANRKKEKDRRQAELEEESTRRAKAKTKSIGQDKNTTKNGQDDNCDEECNGSGSKMVHLKPSSNSTNALLTKSSPTKFDWKLKGSDWITEARNLYLTTEEGEYIFLQVAFTDTNWPVAASFQISCRYFDTRSANLEDGEWMTIKEGKIGHSFECTNHSTKHLELNQEKTSLSLSNTQISERLEFRHQGKKINLDLNFSGQTEILSFLDGSIGFGENEEDGNVNMRFSPAGQVNGTVTIDGKEHELKSSGACIHQFQGIRPNLIATQWNLAIFNGDDGDSLLMIQVRTPQTYGNETVNLGLLWIDGNELACKNNKISPSHPTLDKESKYYMPTIIDYKWSGKDKKDNPFTATIHSKPKTLAAKINILSQCPFIMRKIIETFVTRPFVYQWVDRAECKVNRTIAGEKSEHLIHGWLIQEISLLSDEE